MTRPWLKITFDPTMIGVALVSNYPRKRKVRAFGQWVVFDKDRGLGPIKEYHAGCRLFNAETVDECHQYIRQHESAQSLPQG